jgi:hypothetical protein
VSYLLNQIDGKPPLADLLPTLIIRDIFAGATSRPTAALAARPVS